LACELTRKPDDIMTNDGVQGFGARFVEAPEFDRTGPAPLPAAR
ncbi:MAG: hypothetical protein QM765_00020, partial [Myxococcales bacterium]